jgi:DNA mismatch repair protein MutL
MEPVGREEAKPIARNAFPQMPAEAKSEPIPAPSPKPTAIEPVSVPQQSAPSVEKAVAPQTAPLPSYRIVGEVFRSYVIVETEEKMLIIDKHAAHERILFEQLKSAMHEQKSCAQMLMLPVDVMMTSGEVEALRQYENELESMGFSLRFARNTVSADAIPEEISPAAVPDMLQSMAGRILTETGNAKLTRDILFEKALYQAACKAAIKAGRSYADEHVEWIVKKLMECPDITFCPHGRPVAMELSHHALDRQFDRLGF